MMEMIQNATGLQLAGTLFFFLGIMHTFLVKPVEHFGHHFPAGSTRRNLFHFFSEVEAVFGFWSLALICFIFATQGGHGVIEYIEAQNYTEPAFVFVIMCMAGTRPVIIMAGKMIELVSKLIPLPKKMAFYMSAMILGPLLGSFITEPAAMTVTALILLEHFYKKGMSKKFMYATVGLLFVSVSIGGTLTNFAAPPVLMVAGKWGWGMEHMVRNFGLKSVIAVIISTIVVAMMFRKELSGDLNLSGNNDGKAAPPFWVYLSHIIFLALVVLTSHHMSVFLAIFIFFVGFAKVTEKYQDQLKIRESLMVGWFLAGLVTLGAQQAWWLQVTITKMSDLVLYFGATALTAVTDNAALTYLGSLVELTDTAKYFLVAGAVTGGGLTVIANAPNPAGYGILKDSFGEEGITPLGLLCAATLPTIIAIVCLGFLPSF